MRLTQTDEIITMNTSPVSIATILCSVLPSIAAAQVTSVRSSIESMAHVNLTVVDESDIEINSDEQFGSIDPLGPISSTATINSAQGNYSSSSTASASFINNEQFSFQSGASYQGSRAPGEIQAQSFGHTLHGRFEYDFIIPTEGTINIDGLLTNGGPSIISFHAVVQVLAESTLGGGFTGAFFEQLITDTELDSESFNFAIPLDRPSGSYRVTIRLSHSGLGQLDTDLKSGSLTTNFTIDAENPCPADLNGDETLDFFDVSAFLTAFSANDPIADFNADGLYDFFDISAFLSLYAQGC